MAFTGSVEDRLAIHELVMSYGDAVTRKDAKDWGKTWAEDAIWRIPHFPLLEKVMGREEIVRLWSQVMGDYKYIVFTAVLGSLSIENDTAKGVTYTTETGMDIKDNKSRTHGQYEDEFIKKDGNWYFLKRTFSILHQDRL